tara:strand:- start:3600 stop:4364 length:765 start_codon:yes stop_codon:yes gene_type:complete
MLKKRIIFCLLYLEGSFCLSRNFRLQKIGDYEWLINNYGFSNIYNAIDELIILNVSRDSKIDKEFWDLVKKISSNFFIPITVGGKINNIEDANRSFGSGADKILINTNLKDSELINSISSTYGSQAIIGGIDFKIKDNPVFYTSNADIQNNEIHEYIKLINKIDIGEVYFQSIDFDGTGQGLDINFYSKYCSKLNKPILIGGGIGKPEHILEGLRLNFVDGVVTANLLNFVKDGLIKARQFVNEKFENVTKRQN